MDIDRAREIIMSKDDIEVKYRGKPVWINSINPAIGKAFIVFRDGTDTHDEVPIEELQEE